MYNILSILFMEWERVCNAYQVPVTAYTSNSRHRSVHHANIRLQGSENVWSFVFFPNLWIFDVHELMTTCSTEWVGTCDNALQVWHNSIYQNSLCIPGGVITGSLGPQLYSAGSGKWFHLPKHHPIFQFSNFTPLIHAEQLRSRPLSSI